MVEAARIREQRRRMWRRNDGPEEFATMTEVSAEEDDPEDSTTMTEASLDESEETARLSERLRQRRQRCVYCHRKLTTASNASAEEDRPDDSATTTEALAEDEE